MVTVTLGIETTDATDRGRAVVGGQRTTSEYHASLSTAEQPRAINVLELYDFALAMQAEQEFAALANRWHAETGGQSAPYRIIGHDAYLTIIAMRERAIPMILRDLRDRGGYWYPALRAILRAIKLDAPDIPADARGDVTRMTQAWLAWGVANGYRA